MQVTHDKLFHIKVNILPKKLDHNVSGLYLVTLIHLTFNTVSLIPLSARFRPPWLYDLIIFSYAILGLLPSHKNSRMIFLYVWNCSLFGILITSNLYVNNGMMGVLTTDIHPSSELDLLD